MQIRSISSPPHGPIAESVVPFEATFVAGDGAQANVAISPAISATQRLLVHRIKVATDNDNAAGTAIRIGFGAATLPAAALAGVAGIVFSHPDMAAGIQAEGIPGEGAAGEELRITSEAGGYTVNYLYEIVPG